MTQHDICGREQSSALSEYKCEIAGSAVQHFVKKSLRKQFLGEMQSAVL